MATAKLTKRTVDRLEAPETGESWLWDVDLKGFGVKALPTGKKVYAVKYRARGNRATKKYTLGAHGALTPDGARDLAKQLLGGVANGENPARALAGEKQAPTVAGLSARFLGDSAAKNRASTVAQYRRQFKLYVLPRLGSLKVAGVTRSDVDQLHLALLETPVVANRVLALLSAFFTWSVQRGYRPDETNPCRFINRYREEGRTRYLSTEEYGRLGASLKEAETNGLPLTGEELANAEKYPLYQIPLRTPPNPQGVAALRLLMLTGCRHTEITTLQWVDVDRERKLLHLRQSKTGKATRQLNLPALEVLDSIPRVEGVPYVFPGVYSSEPREKKSQPRTNPLKPMTTLRRLWHRVREHAGLADVRLHDLRHSFASVGAGGGSSLPVIGAILGHAKASTTQRYAHLANTPVQEASERIGKEIDALLSGTNTPVTPLRRVST